VTCPGKLVTAVVENTTVSESTGEEAGYSSTTGISVDKFLVFVMKVMVFFVPVLNKVLNSDPCVKTHYEITLQYIN
jgi:hypothetical protein